MRVNLEPQRRVENPETPENPKEIVVASEKHVQSHLDVVPVLVLPAPHLTPHERPRLEYLHLVTCLRKVHRRDHPRQPAPDNANFHFLVLGQLDLRPLARPDRFKIRFSAIKRRFFCQYV